MHIISLDKKLLKVSHVLNKSELNEIKLKHGLTKEQVQEQVQRQLYQKFMEGIYRYIPTSVTPNPDGDELYEIQGYVLSHLSMWELMQELLEMDNMGKEMLLKEVSHAITYRQNKMK